MTGLRQETKHKGAEQKVTEGKSKIGQNEGAEKAKSKESEYREAEDATSSKDTDYR